ncbi:ETS domain-containing protein Elk-1 [Fasciola hepatica]|uniref:ETS domain-containing protein Elk-1 n=1 Tax=Fasciola hepatica TaxID=6192 RepID=A0A4E0RIU7_FASHE|nr:ETS domain-containing protein Elk-1 [Fasciola hepatica]
MGSPGPVSVAHTTASELAAPFIRYPTAMGLCDVMQNGPVLNTCVNRVGSPGQKRLFAHSVSSTLSDSDGDASEDKSILEWSVRGHIRDPGLCDDEQSGSQVTSEPTYRPNKCRILTNKDRGRVSVTPQFDQPFETSFDGPMDRSLFPGSTMDDPIPVDIGPEEVSDLGANGGKLTLWQFLLELLLSNRYRKLIRWTNKKGEFILLQAEAVAKLWGLYKDRNHRMNYDKLSRALRYYYEKNIIRKVHGHKFVYQFMGLRNLIKICQETSNNPIPSRPSLDPVLTDCTQTAMKQNAEWDSPARTTLHLDSPPSRMFPHNEDSGANGVAVTKLNNTSERLDEVVFAQNGLSTKTDAARTMHSHSLDNLIDRWPLGGNQCDGTTNSNIATITSTSAATTISTVQRLINRSPALDEIGSSKVRHSQPTEPMEIPASFNDAPLDACDSNQNMDNSSSVRVNDFSNLICSLASFMSLGHWMPQISNPSDSSAAFDLTSSVNMITKPSPTNFFLNPMSDPLWLTQLVQNGREVLKSAELGRERESNHCTLTGSKVFSSAAQSSSKSSVPLVDTSDNSGQCLGQRDRSLLNGVSPLASSTALTEKHQGKTLSDPVIRLPSPDCRCSCHSASGTNSKDDWSRFNSFNNTNTSDAVSTANTVQNTSTHLFPTDPSIPSINSTDLLPDPAYCPLSSLPVNLASETSPTKLHHQRHAINMQRLGEQLSLIGRSCHSHSISKSPPTVPMNTVSPGTNNNIHNTVIQPASSMPAARDHLTGLKDTATSECTKTNPSFGCVPDQFPRFSTTDPGSRPSNGEPCVWMPVPVTMLTSWIRLLSGMTTDPGGVCSQTRATTPVDTNGPRQPESDVNSVGLVQPHLLSLSNAVDTFPRLKTESRESDHFARV